MPCRHMYVSVGGAPHCRDVILPAHFYHTPGGLTPPCLPPILPARLQLLEEALEAAQQEAASLRQAHDRALKDKAEEDAAAMGTVQASFWLLLASIALPLLQALYSGLRFLLWLAEQLGVM